MSKNVSYSKGEKYNSLSKKDGFRSRAAYKSVSYTHLTLPTRS